MSKTLELLYQNITKSFCEKNFIAIERVARLLNTTSEEYPRVHIKATTAAMDQDILQRYELEFISPKNC